MTPLTRRLSRRCICPLDGSWGIDRGRRVVITLIPGKPNLPDILLLRPEKTRRSYSISVDQVMRSAILRDVAIRRLEKARKKKEQKARLRERRKLDYMERKLRT